MGQTQIKRSAAGTATSKSEYMFVGYDRSVAAVLGVTAAVLIEWVRHSSQYGKYAPEWRARREQVGALLMLSESAVKRALRKVKESGVIVIREVPERMSYNGYALHFSVNAIKLEEIKSKGREIMLRDGWLKPPKVTVTKGQKRSAVGKGPEGLQRPQAGGDSGSKETLSAGRLEVSVGPLTSNSFSCTSYRRNTNTAVAPVAALPAPSACVENIPTKKLKEKEENNSREIPPVAPPPLLFQNSTATSSKVDAKHLLDDLVKRFDESRSFATIKSYCQIVVTAAHGAENVVPLTAADKKCTEDFLSFCDEAGISLLDFLRLCVNKWYSLDHTLQWAKLAVYPVYGSIYRLRNHMLPYYMQERAHEKSYAEAPNSYSRAFRPQCEGDRQKAKAEQRLEALRNKYSYKQCFIEPSELPEDFPSREAIINYLKNGIPVVADGRGYTRIDDLSPYEQVEWKRRRTNFR